MTNKKCSKCKKTKLIEEFHRHKLCPDGHRPQCKECRKVESKEYYLVNKIKISKRQQIYRKNNKKKCDSRIKKWAQDNKFRYWASVARRNHKPKNIVNITLKELTEIAEYTEICSICKIKLDYSLNKGRHQYNSPSLDRMNNENYLDIKNVWIICRKCNTTKNNRTVQEFIEYCKTVIKNLT